MHGAVGRVDGPVCVSAPFGVGVGNGNTANRLSSASNDSFIIFVVEQRIWRVGIAMGPAIYRDSRNVALAREAAFAKHSVELITNAAFDLVETHFQNVLAADAKLGARIEALVRRACNVTKVKAHRLSWMARMPVGSETNGIVELDTAVERHGRGDVMDAEVGPRLPILDHNVVVEHRRLGVLAESLPLIFRQFRHDVWDDHIEAREHDMFSRDAR